MPISCFNLNLKTSERDIPQIQKWKTLNKRKFFSFKQIALPVLCPWSNNIKLFFQSYVEIKIADATRLQCDKELV